MTETKKEKIMALVQDNGKPLTAYGQYVSEVKWIPPLTSEEETTQLLQSFQKGVDVQRVRDRLVKGCQYLVLSLAKRFVRDCQYIEVMDFVQEGNLGLLEAIERYDRCKAQSSFQTFAFTWVRTTMLLAYWQQERAIRIPFNKVRAIRQMNVVCAQLLDLVGHEPTVTEIAQEMGVKERDIHELIALQEQQIVSLSLPLDDSGETSLEDVLEDPTASAFTDEGFYSIDDVFALLTKRERAVLQLRYGLIDGCTYTQQEVANLLSVSLSHVQVIDRRAKMRLRQALVA